MSRLRPSLTCLRLSIFFIIVSSPVLAETCGLLETQPNLSLSPLRVVKIVMRALQQNDFPSTNCGIAVTYKLASPANQRMTGPLSRFITMVKGPVYGNMIGHLGASYENIRVDNEHAAIDVIIKVKRLGFQGFRFFLSKQQDNKLKGTWLTDAVIPIEVISS